MAGDDAPDMGAGAVGDANGGAGGGAGDGESGKAKSDGRFDPELIDLYLLTAALMLGYGAIFSLLAEIRDSFGLSNAGVGFIGAAAFASGFVAQLFLARLADIGHGRRMLQIGLAICILSTVWMIFADSLLEWIVSRGALGFGTGVVRPAIRRHIVISNPRAAGKALGLLTACETAGFLLGPVIAAMLNVTLGLPATFILFALMLMAFIPSVMRIQIPGAFEPPARDVMLTLLRQPAMQSCIALGVAFWITVGVFEAIWAVFLTDLGASLMFIGLTMSLFSIPMIFIAPYAGELAHRRGPLNVAVFSLGAAIICMLAYGGLASIWLLCIPLFIHAIVDAFTMPAIQLAVVQASGKNAIASGQGLTGAVSMAVGAITAATGGVLYDQTGAAGLWWISGAAMTLLLIFAWYRGDALKAA